MGWGLGVMRGKNGIWKWLMGLMKVRVQKILIKVGRMVSPKGSNWTFGRGIKLLKMVS